MIKNLTKLTLILLACTFTTTCDSQSSGGDEDEIDDGGVVVVPSSMFIGTYTRNEGWVNGTADGIYRASINLNEGTVVLTETAAEVINPSFVAISPDSKNLYAVSELNGNDGSTGFIHAFTINEDSSLSLINTYPTGSLSPAHVSLDVAGEFVFAANYQGGVVVVFSRNPDGSLQIRQQLDHSGSGPHPNQNGSHTHMVKVSPDNEFLFVPDLGSDKIWSYRIDHDKKTLSKTSQEFGTVAAGSGPRHMDFHPTLSIAYVINELSSTVTVFDYNSTTGALTEKQTLSTLPSSFKGSNSTADIHVHSNGKFLYSSNRGHNSISSFSIEENSGELTALTHTSTEGEVPRNFALHPTEDLLFAANQNSNSITVFDVNTGTGALSFTGNSLAVNTPVCIVFY